MADSLTPKDWATVEELMLSCMWDTGALIEVLEKKGILTKQELLDAIHDLRVKNPTAKLPPGLTDSMETPKPNPELTEDVIIKKILDLFVAAQMDTYQSQEWLEKTQAILEIGKRAVKGTKDH